MYKAYPHHQQWQMAVDDWLSSKSNHRLRPTCRGQLPQLLAGHQTSSPVPRALWGSREVGPGHTSAQEGYAWWWHRCSLGILSPPAEGSVTSELIPALNMFFIININYTFKFYPYSFPRTSFFPNIFFICLFYYTGNSLLNILFIIFFINTSFPDTSAFFFINIIHDLLGRFHSNKQLNYHTAVYRKHSLLFFRPHCQGANLRLTKYSCLIFSLFK